MLEVETNPQRIIDDEHLRLLAIGHGIAAAFNVVFALFIFGYATFFSMILRSFPSSGGVDSFPDGFEPLALIGVLSTFGGLAFIVGGIGESMTARYLTQRTNHTFCVIVSALDCLSVPFGTLLGIATLITLERPGVRAQFQSRQSR
jgi:hypothetical protein